MTSLITRQFFCLLLFVGGFIACYNKGEQTGISKNDSTATIAMGVVVYDSLKYEAEQDYLKRRKILCKRLALYDIEKSTDAFELRLWHFPSLHDPSILYILKAKDTTWTLFHYQYYTLWATGIADYFDSPVVDSVIMESVRPQKTNWQTYISNLQLDSLWNMQTESSIKGKTFAVLDGERYILELNANGKYKYLFYTAPEYFQDKDSNHNKFTEFTKRLVIPIIYKGMVNP